MKGLDRQSKALLLSFSMFLLLVVSIVVIAFLIDVETLNSGSLLFLTSVVLCVLISKITYDKAVEKDRVQSSAQQLAEQWVSSSEELFTVVYYNSPVPYVLIDKQGVIISANIAAIRLFHSTEDKIRGLDVFSLFGTSDSDQYHISFLKDKFSSGLAIENEEVVIKIPNYKESWVLMSLFHFVDSTRRELGLLTLVDISRQKSIDKAKSEFVSLASHQLRTPITGMRWSAELLLVDKSEQLSAKQRQYVNRLLESIGRMSTLINDFLNVSRLELGTLSAIGEVINLDDLFEKVIEEQEFRIQQKNLTVNRKYDKDLEEIVSDPDLLRMVLSNLYSNAVKYTRQNGFITMSYTRDKDSVVIEVSDTGMGIPAGEQDHVFEKIYRASNALKEVPDGTGLGLYIVKEAVNVLKGQISFISAENQGTTFIVKLPITL